MHKVFLNVNSFYRFKNQPLSNKTDVSLDLLALKTFLALNKHEAKTLKCTHLLIDWLVVHLLAAQSGSIL